MEKDLYKMAPFLFCISPAIFIIFGNYTYIKKQDWLSQEDKKGLPSDTSLIN